MKVIAVQHNPMIYESAYETISIHRTKEGAAKAMVRLKSVEFEKELDILEINDEDFCESRIGIFSRDTRFDSFRYKYMEIEE